SSRRAWRPTPDSAGWPEAHVTRSISYLTWSFGVPFKSPITYRFDVVQPPANGIVVTHLFFEDGADRTNGYGFFHLLGRHRIGEFDIDLDTRIRTPRTDTENLLACRAISNELDAALAEDASIPFQPDCVGSVVRYAFGELVREAGDHHAHFIANGLKSAPTAFLTAGAVVIAFGEQYFDQRLADIGGLRFIHLDAHAVRDADGARRDHSAVDLDRTCAASTQCRLSLQVAQGGDVDTRLRGDIDKISAFF